MNLVRMNHVMRAKTIRGAVRKTSGNGLSLDVYTEPTFDVVAMSASAIICTNDVDRELELIDPRGVTKDNYRRNPVVMWEHGLIPELALPLGKSEDPTGLFTVIGDDDVIEATCYFSQSSLPAEQIFRLIEEGVVRATSIHVLPSESQQIRVEGLACPVCVHTVSDMLEWSWGAMGVNPHAVAKALTSGVAGKPLVDGIRKSLLPFQPARKSWAGVTLEVPKMSVQFPVPVVAPASTTPPPAIPAAAAAKAIDPATGVDPAAVPPATDFVSTEPPADMPAGAVALQDIHAMISDVAAAVTAKTKSIEQPTVKEGLQEVADSLQIALESVRGVFATAYPELEPIKEATAEDTAGDAMKSFVASNKFRLGGLASTAKSLAKSTSDAKIRPVLERFAESLGRFERDAQSATKPKPVAKSVAAASQAPVVPVPVVQPAVDGAMLAVFEKIAEKLGKICPAA